MALITATQNATVKRTNPSVNGPVSAKGMGYTVHVLASAVEVASSTAVGNTLLFGSIPANARITGGGVYWDDLTTSATTLDIGLAGKDTTADPDAINDGLDVSSAGSGNLLKAVEDYGELAWTIAGDSADPGGDLQVYGSLVDAAYSGSGTVSVVVEYVVD